MAVLPQNYSILQLFAIRQTINDAKPLVSARARGELHPGRQQVKVSGVVRLSAHPRTMAQWAQLNGKVE
jgi:hypothetical protein